MTAERSSQPATSRPALVLVQPRIPQNVGAVGRLCAACRATLHIVRPIPFDLSDRSLRRAGMDYLELLDMVVHADWDSCRESLQGRRLWFLSSGGSRSLHEVRFRSEDVLVLGCETAGLAELVPGSLTAENTLRLPMPEPRARCLNLAMAAGIGLYEVLRQVEGW